MAHVIPPRRDESLIHGTKASLRYIKFFEDLSDSQNAVSVSTAETITLSGGNYTTIASNTLICINPVNITLNATPVNREIVTITSTNGDVIVNGNSRTMSGDLEVIMGRNYTTLSFFYSLEQNKWFIQ